MESKSICSPPVLFFSLSSRVFSHLRRPKRTNISTISFFKESSINTGKRLEVKICLQSSRILSWRCSVMMEARDQLLSNSKITHGCKWKWILKDQNKIYWNNFTRRDLPRLLILQIETQMMKTWEESQCSNWSEYNHPTLRTLLSMIWLIMISIITQESSMRS
jgi:hypothetical protein